MLHADVRPGLRGPQQTRRRVPPLCPKNDQLLPTTDTEGILPKARGGMPLFITVPHRAICPLTTPPPCGQWRTGASWRRWFAFAHGTALVVIAGDGTTERASRQGSPTPRRATSGLLYRSLRWEPDFTRRGSHRRAARPPQHTERAPDAPMAFRTAAGAGSGRADRRDRDHRAGVGRRRLRRRYHIRCPTDGSAGWVWADFLRTSPKPPSTAVEPQRDDERTLSTVGTGSGQAVEFTTDGHEGQFVITTGASASHIRAFVHAGPVA